MVSPDGKQSSCQMNPVGQRRLEHPAGQLQLSPLMDNGNVGGASPAGELGEGHPYHGETDRSTRSTLHVMPASHLFL